jgi:transposase
VTDALTDLRTALADRCRIERELGHGGMATGGAGRSGGNRVEWRESDAGQCRDACHVLAPSTARLTGLQCRCDRAHDAALSFLSELVASQPKPGAIHVIADNLSAHKTPQVQAFLAAHPRVTMHYTPTYSSWLNQVELWFAKIERRRHRAWHLHLADRPGARAAALHPSVQSHRHALPLVLRGSKPAHPSTFELLTTVH